MAEDSLKKLVCDVIDRESVRLKAAADEIWQHRELCFNEHKSHATLTQFLEESGFKVERHHKLDTAFVARWGEAGNDDAGALLPHIAMICEYDALPEIGHACGHNLIAEIGLGAGIAVKAAMEASCRKLGRLSVIGTPAEEGGGGKIDLIKAGVFDDVDVAMMSHPAPFTDARPIFLGGRRFTATFHGRSSHAAGYPWEGVNALDAAVLAYNSVSALRQQMRPGWRAHMIITKGGTKTNIIPAEAQMALQVRAPVDSQVDELEAKVKACVTSAASATGCTVAIEDGAKPYSSLTTNETLAKLYETNATRVGVVFPPAHAPKNVLGSTDMGNLSKCLPSLHPCYDCGTQAANHTPDFNTHVGTPAAQPSTLAQAKALAMVAVDVFSNPDLLQRVNCDFLEDKKNF